MSVDYDADLTALSPPSDFFDFDADSDVDWDAWEQASPNFYVNGIAWSKARFTLGFDVGLGQLAIIPTDLGRAGLRGQGSVPSDDPERTRQVVRAYTLARINLQGSQELPGGQ